MNDWIYAIIDSLVLAISFAVATLTINRLSYNVYWPWWQYFLSGMAILLFGVIFKIITDYRQKQSAKNAGQKIIKDAD